LKLEGKVAFVTGASAGIGAAVGFLLSCLAVIAIGVRRDKVLSREQIGYVAEQSAARGWKEES